MIGDPTRLHLHPLSTSPQRLDTIATEPPLHLQLSDPVRGSPALRPPASLGNRASTRTRRLHLRRAPRVRRLRHPVGRGRWTGHRTGHRNGAFVVQPWGPFSGKDESHGTGRQLGVAAPAKSRMSTEKSRMIKKSLIFEEGSLK